MIVCNMLLAIESDSDREFMMNLYQEYYHLMRSKAYSVLNENDGIDDIINDACVRLISKIQLLREFGSCKLAAYIVYTVRSVSVDFVRKQNVRNKWTYNGFEDDIEMMPDDSQSIEDILLRDEEIENLRKAILLLSEKERDILHYKYTLEMNDEEISQIIGTKTSSVRNIIARIRKKVYAIMRREVGGDER